MIIVITCLYFISWTPFYVIQVAALSSNVLNEKNFFFIFILIHMMCFLNSMCNPIVYYFMSEKLKLGFKCIFLTLFHQPLPVNRNIETSNQSRLDQRLLSPGYTDSGKTRNHLHHSENSCHKSNPSHSQEGDFM